MEEELKYYKIKVNNKKGYICGYSSQIEKWIETCKEIYPDCEITECEKPTDADVCIPAINIPAINNTIRGLNGIGGYHSQCWAGENCKRCTNRFNTDSDFCLKHHKDKTCYRFKLDC